MRSYLSDISFKVLFTKEGSSAKTQKPPWENERGKLPHLYKGLANAVVMRERGNKLIYMHLKNRSKQHAFLLKVARNGSSEHSDFRTC